MTFDRLLSWIEASPVAAVVRDSTLITGMLSGLHLIGMTLLLGAAAVTSLRVIGVALADRPVAEVARAARFNIAVALALSVSTGLILAAPRASAAAVNETFRLKMLLLAAAGLFQVGCSRRVLEGSTPDLRLARVYAVVSLMLWFSVAAAGVAYILLE